MLFGVPLWWVSSEKVRLRLKMPRTTQTAVRRLQRFGFFFMSAYNSSSSWEKMSEKLPASRTVSPAILSKTRGGVLNSTSWWPW